MTLEFLDSGFIGVIIGTIVAGSISFFVQRWYFERTIKKQIIEDICFPLLDELSDIKDCVNNLETINSFHRWTEIRQKSRHRWLPKKLMDSLIQFFDVEINNYDRNTIACYNLIDNTFRDEVVKPMLDKGIRAGNVSATSQSFDSTILRYDVETGNYIGTSPPFLPPIPWKYNDFPVDVQLELGNTDEIVKHIAIQIKDHPMVLQVKQGRPKLIQKIQELKTEIEKETNL